MLVRNRCFAAPLCWNMGSAGGVLKDRGAGLASGLCGCRCKFVVRCAAVLAVNGTDFCLRDVAQDVATLTQILGCRRGAWLFVLRRPLASHVVGH